MKQLDYEEIVELAKTSLDGAIKEAHEHKFFAYGEPTGFNMCLAMRAEECDPASHGGTNVHARCSICGKEARFNRNGDRYEPHRPGEKFMGWEVAP